MFAAIGVDCWVVVPIASTSRKELGHNLEGTRLTITRSRDQADAYEFSIRTPVTPSRWEDFDKELAAGFEAICAAAIAEGVLLTLPHAACLAGAFSVALVVCCCLRIGENSVEMVQLTVYPKHVYLGMNGDAVVSLGGRFRALILLQQLFDVQTSQQLRMQF